MIEDFDGLIVIDRAMTQKKLLVSLLIVVTIITTFCIDDKRKSQAPDPLIKLSDLPIGYYYNEYTTGAIPKAKSFKISSDFSQSILHNDFQEYYGKIPIDRKRISTIYKLYNNNSSIDMLVYIYEFDSDSGFEEFFSNMEGNYRYCKDYTMTTNLIGCHSILMVIEPEYYVLQFNIKNYLIMIFGDSTDRHDFGNDTIQEEMLKVAEAIEIKLDDS
jgi:hypothetical protein